MSLESEWADRKAYVYETIDALMENGLSFEIAKRISGWNPTLAFATFAGMQDGSDSGESGLVDGLRLYVSRSPNRINAGQLEGEVIDAGKLYAVFIADIPALNISQIQFRLDGVPVQIEGTAPWDFEGTNFDGSANRTNFVVGDHIIDAYVTVPSGIHVVSASFSVE